MPEDHIPLPLAERLLFQAADLHLASTHEVLYEKLDQILFECLGRSAFTVFLADKASHQLKLSHSTLGIQETSGWNMELSHPALQQLIDLFEDKDTTFLEGSLLPKRFPFPIAWCALLRHESAMYGLVVIHEGVDLSTHDSFPAKEIFKPLFHHFTKAHCEAEVREAIESQFGDTTGKLLAINEVAELLGQLDLDTLLPKVMSLALHLAKGEVGNLMIDRHGHLETKVEWGLPEADARGITLTDGTAMVDHCFKNESVFVSNELRTDSRVVLKLQSHRIHSIVTVPLYTKTKALGVLNLVNTGKSEAFLSENISTLQTVARLASTAIENAILHQNAIEQKVFEEQLRIARQIWEHIMPQSLPQIPNATLGANSIPATTIGGDFYDFIATGEDRLALVIADVSGKGIPAAMMMNTAKSVLHIEAMRNPSPFELVQNVNKLLIQSAKMEGFITLTYVMVDLALKRLYITNAGHNPTLLYRSATQTCEKLESESIPLAIMADQTFPCVETHFDPGDVILLYTDGITESRNDQKQMFETERLSQILVTHSPQKSAGEIVKAVFQGVKTFSSGTKQHDDMTVVCLKFNAAMDQTPTGNL